MKHQLIELCIVMPCNFNVHCGSTGLISIKLASNAISIHVHQLSKAQLLNDNMLTKAPMPFYLAEYN